MAVVYIGIGSNIGDRRMNCETAIARLGNEGVHVTKRSSMIETTPWGAADQPDFINMAVEADTSLSPVGLLRLLKGIEAAMGRETAKRWGPRLIDLDILLYDDLVISTEELIVPHPHMHERDFVLIPMTEINPAAVHPLLKKTMAEIRKARTSPN